MAAMLHHTPDDHWTTDPWTWSLGAGGWVPVSPPNAIPLPTADDSVFLVYDSDRHLDVVMVFPRGASDPAVGVWEWDGQSWTHTTPSGGPHSVSQWASAAYDPALHATVMVDGDSFEQGRVNTWLLDAGGWRAISAPDYPDPGPVVVLNYDSVHHTVVALDKNYVTWRFDGADWQPVAQMSGPTPSVSAGMGRQAPEVTFDPDHARWIVFGGFTGYVELDDTWTGDETSWTERTPLRSPSPRSSFPGTPSIAWDPGLSDAILYGAFGEGVRTSPDLDDTWAWDGTTWTQLAGPYYPGPSPSPASGARTTSS